MDVTRVMEIWCPAAGAVGSGYAIADDLVLTAYHVVHGTEPGGVVKVRQLDRTGRSVWLTAQLCWPPTPVDTKREPERDGALLRVTDPAWRAPAAGAVRCGRITGTERLPCQGVGFPDATLRPGSSRRGSLPISGHFEPLYDYRSALTTVHVDEGIVPRRLANGSGWAGSSGAALFSGPFLIAVLATDKDVADTAQVLEATPVAVLMEQPGFARTLRRHHAPTDLHDVTGTRDVPPRPSAAASPPLERALRGLPRRSRVFAGRESALAELLGLLEPEGAAQEQSAVGVVTGLPGVGKTELAVQAAHMALERGWFPGGTLFLDLRGYDPEQALSVDAALDAMLRMLDIPAESIPTGDDLSRLFTSTMERYAAEGRRILVVIDNVRSGDIAEALIPPVGCALVTSRHALGSVRGQRVDLEELSRSAAVEVLDRELRLRHGSDTRVTGQYEDAAAIARLCGELPLALHIVAALLAEDTARPLSSMAGDLRDASTRLDELRYPEDTRGERGVRAAFDLSHRQLDAEQARVLRLLTVNAGPEISTEAVAAMAQTDVRTARRRLEELRGMHLIRSGSSYGQHGRWGMHDLIHVYVTGLPARPADLRASFLLLLLHYVRSALEATRLLDPTAARRADSPFSDRAQALEWLDTEYANLTPFGNFFLGEPASARTLTADLFLGMWRYLEFRRRTDDWIDFTTNALTIARALGDRAREAEALSKLGGAFRQARRFDEAVDACREAITIQRARGNRLGEGVALNNLAAALAEAKRYDEAISVAREAAALFRQIGDRHREGIALSHLGGALRGAGHHAEGLAAYEESARIGDEIGDPRLRVAMLAGLGDALHRGGAAPEDFLDPYRQARQAMVEAGDAHGEGMVLSNLSVALITADQFDEAAAAAQDAVALLRGAEDPHSLGAALVNLSTALRETGRPGEAAEVLADAVAAFGRSGDHDAEAEAAISRGDALHEAGDLPGAITSLRGTAEMCRAREDRRGEGRALGGLGDLLREDGQQQAAVTTLRAAATLCHAAGDSEGEAMALATLATALLPDRADEAIAAFRDSARLHLRSGDPDQARLGAQMLRAMRTATHARGVLQALLAAGRYEALIADYLSSSTREVGDRGLAGVSARELGLQLVTAGRFDQAVTVLEEAVTAFRQAGDADREHAARAELETARTARRDAEASALGLEHALRHADEDSPELTAAIEEATGHLGPHDARFFRLLAAAPGPDVSLAAASILAVADRATILARIEELSALATDRNHLRLHGRMAELCRDDTETALGCLDVLTRMRLVEPDPDDPRRWRLPAAIRPFAAHRGAQHAGPDLREQVRTLLRLHYLAGAHSASAPLDRGVFAPALHQPQAQGIDWLVAEYPHLVATVVHAGDDDLGAVIALDMTRALTHVMNVGDRLGDALRLGAIARRAARRLHDRDGEAVVVRNLGVSLLRAGQLDPAVAALRDALALYRDLGDAHGEGTTLTTLGSALTHARQFPEADTVLRAAIALHHGSGSVFSEAVARSAWGILLATTGQRDLAISAFDDADRLFRKIGDQYHRAATLTQLADCLREAGREDEAAKTDRRAVLLARMSGNGAAAALALGAVAAEPGSEGPGTDEPGSADARSSRLHRPGQMSS